MAISPDKCFIAVAGNIGAGKSTLTRLLSDSLGWKPFYEAAAENPYLADFYADMQTWSFHSQVFYLGKRLEHHRLLVDHPYSVVQDRTVYEDAEIFATNLFEQGLMNDRDYSAYWNLYRAVGSFLPPPSLIVYLQASTKTLSGAFRSAAMSTRRASPLSTLTSLIACTNVGSPTGPPARCSPSPWTGLISSTIWWTWPAWSTRSKMRCASKDSEPPSHQGTPEGLSCLSGVFSVPAVQPFGISPKLFGQFAWRMVSCNSSLSTNSSDEYIPIHRAIFD